jgi:phosphoribosylaminoimidazole-succinocarboxamide synthase
MTTILETRAGSIPRRQGKVRDIYDLGERAVLVATDRISAFDWVLPNGIPDKGRVLTGLSLFWFNFLDQPHHLISTDLEEMGEMFAADRPTFSGRSMLVRKATVVPFECVVRGYLSGSGWKEYQKQGTVCGQRLPKGLVESQQLPEPIFTPATKAETGHDENVSVEHMASRIGAELANELRRRSVAIYERARRHAIERGIVLADTKFEFGRLPDGTLILIDEVLTPDSSRFWPVDDYRPGGPQPSFDKQFVRDWLESIHFDKNSPPPAMPDSIVNQTREKYIDAYNRITGQSFDAYLRHCH